MQRKREAGSKVRAAREGSTKERDLMPPLRWFPAPGQFLSRSCSRHERPASAFVVRKLLKENSKSLSEWLPQTSLKVHETLALFSREPTSQCNPSPATGRDSCRLHNVVFDFTLS